MGVAIVVIAGQSNARRISNEVEDALIERYGVDGYVLVKSYVSGAPLTRDAPNKDDWATDSELASQLVSDLKTAVAENPDGYSGGLIWVQGEADTWASANPDIYRQRLEGLIDRVSTEVSSGPGFAASTFANLKVAISQLADMAPEAAARGYWSDIIVSQKKTARFSDNVTSVDPDNLAEAFGFSQNAMFDDPMHYSTYFSKVLASQLVLRASDMSVENQVSSFPQDKPRTEVVQDYWLRGTSAADKIFAQAGNGRIEGYGGNDILRGNNGDDEIYGNNGDDFIFGRKGNDKLYGGENEDTLHGGNGNDLLSGGMGRDVVFGEGGSDVFEFKGGDLINWSYLSGTRDERNAELDLIGDFVVGTDKIQFNQFANVNSRSDLNVWKTIIDGNVHFTIRVKDTGERILVDVAEVTTYSDMHDANNFIFL